MSANRNSYVASLQLLQNQGFPVKTVLEVGAAEGVLYLLRKHYGLYPDAYQVFFDCMDENESIYQLYQEKVPSDYVIAAVDVEPGHVQLSVDPGSYNTHIAGVQHEQEGYQERSVPAVTLDQIRSERQWEAPYYVHLDVQGNELGALSGGLEVLKETSIVVAELQLFAARDTFADFVEFMRQQDFVLFDVTDPGHYLTTPILYQVYATFIPARMDFRQDLSWAEGDTLANAKKGLQERRERNIEQVTRFLNSLPPISK